MHITTAFREVGVCGGGGIRICHHDTSVVVNATMGGMFKLLRCHPLLRPQQSHPCPLVTTCHKAWTIVVIKLPPTLCCSMYVMLKATPTGMRVYPTGIAWLWAKASAAVFLACPPPSSCMGYTHTTCLELVHRLVKCSQSVPALRACSIGLTLANA